MLTHSSAEAACRASVLLSRVPMSVLSQRRLRSQGPLGSTKAWPAAPELPKHSRLHSCSRDKLLSAAGSMWGTLFKACSQLGQSFSLNRVLSSATPV